MVTQIKNLLDSATLERVIVGEMADLGPCEEMLTEILSILNGGVDICGIKVPFLATRKHVVYLAGLVALRELEVRRLREQIAALKAGKEMAP